MTRLRITIAVGLLLTSGCATTTPRQPIRAKSRTIPSPCDGANKMSSARSSVGYGGRFIHVDNGTAHPLRLRLLNGDGSHAARGTLYLPVRGSGRFWIGAGGYQLRVRDEVSCAVMRGTPFAIGRSHRGVQIGIQFTYQGPGGHHGLRRVQEAL